MASDKKKTLTDMFSYRDKLSGTELKRYDDKINLLGGIDPYQINKTKWSSDVSILPTVTYIDIVNYLLWTPSPYTKEDLKSYKGLDAYNQFVNGWVRDKLVTECNGYIVVIAKVLHSQRLNEKPLQPWVVAEKSGTVAAAHCNCMAGLGEACTHIAALLFAIDATVRIRDSKTVTDEKAYWLLPSDMRKMSYEPLKNIDFTSAATAKHKFEQSLDAISSPSTVCQTPKLPREDRTPVATDEDMDIFYRKLAKCNPTSAILSIVEPHCEQFIPKAISEDFPKVLTELKDENCMTMNHSELKKHCEPLMNSITCDAQQQDAVQNVTREQFLSKFWNTFRAGRVTASQAKAVCTSDLNDPSALLIKRICYPGTKSFKNQATKWGIDNEKKASNAFNKVMMESHENVCLESSGFIISTKFPFIGASPDGVFSCDCCGTANVEVKCPFNIRNEGLDKCDYLITDDNGDKCLKTNHQYYYQIQTQLGCSNLEFGYFIVWTENDSC